MKRPQREYQRVYLTFYLRIFEGSDFAGFLIDISREGMMVMAERPFPTDTDHTLRMKIPSALAEGDDDHFITFGALCKWCRQDELDKDVYLCGFQISDISDEDNLLIRKLIEEYRLR